jgi:hypothetical protein
MRGVRETREMPIAGFELREVANGTGGKNLRFTGYASTTCRDSDDDSNAYEMEDYIGPWIESMVAGCFTRTIRESCDCCFVVNHTGVSMARTKPGSLRLAEDSTGLHTEATLNPTRTDVQILRAAIEDGAIDEMSFSFKVLRNRWSYAEDNGVIDRRWITEVSLDKGDVSPCNYGANEHTAGLVAIRNRLFSSEPGRLEPGRRSRRASSPAEGGSGGLVLPDHTTRARLELECSRRPVAARSVHQMVLADIRAGRLGDPVAVAKRDIAAARQQLNARKSR